MNENSFASFDTLTRTIYGEARGETMRGKIAVGWVIRNRVEADLHDDEKPDWWGEGYIGVCRKPRQFSCWNDGDPNRIEIEAADWQDCDFRDCALAALIVMQGYTTDPTHGSTHYHTLGVDPAWDDKMQMVGDIGNHRFYRERKSP